MKHSDSIAYDNIEMLDIGIALQCTRNMLRISDNIQRLEQFMKGQCLQVVHATLCSVNLCEKIQFHYEMKVFL